MDTISDDTYMKTHLSEYILFQADQGYAAIDIKKALQRFGYKKRLIKELFQHLNISTSPKTKPRMYSSNDLDTELRIYVQSLLIDYIVKEHKVGYTLDAIKKALVNFGHDPHLVDEAIQIISQGKVMDYRAESEPLKFPYAIVASLTLFFSFAFLVFLSISTDTSIFKILPNFLPLFISFVLINLAFIYVSNRKTIAALPLFGVIITVVSFIGGIQYGILGKAPGSDVLLILNAVLTFISTGLVCAFSKKGKEEIVVKIKDKKEAKKHKEEEKIVEEKIKVPKLIEPAPKEPYHPPKQNNSMLHYIRHEIDKPKKVYNSPSDVSHLPQKHKRKERLKIKDI
ncbi:hypothetical protein COV16_05375 [Candidatus Woesearchaeota archaeon CG10_big_fil_rev_8_21_14_0_10_34_8]|nr:MAG: hypothetical protein COV16_05375 [Candidatus Woesearchaeota archaeon CG10_big_fil_rev_8_21_14_0_10_34_8]